MDAIVIAGIALVLLLVLIWLARETPRAPAEIVAEAHLPIEELFPLHCRHFPQIRQALSNADEQYLRQRASPALRRRTLRERRSVARRFVAGLREDFVRLEHLGRTIATMSPKVSRRQEFARLELGMRFRVVYRVAVLRLLVGSVSIPQLASLTDVIGSLASETERAMRSLEETSVSRLRSDFSA